MKKLLLVLALFIWILPLSASAEDNVNKVFKIRAYSYEELNNSYYLQQYWSAVYMWNNQIYTNAHVILDADGEPIWNYRVCKTVDFKDEPKCFSTWKLLYYDITNDLAVLEISDPSVTGVTSSTKEPQIGDAVKVYGYPSSGWNTISYTEWKISGSVEWLYKIDANIDAWNSWGWVFDADGNLIWMAVAVKVWYTTMGYVIPLASINNFKNKIGNIEYYTKGVSSTFEKYSTTLDQVVGATSFSNPEITIESFIKYWLKVNDYTIDNDEKYYHLGLTSDDPETYISINNINFSWKSNITRDTLYNILQSRIEETKAKVGYEIYKVIKMRLLWKDAIMSFTKDPDGNVVLVLYFEVWTNNFQAVWLYSNSLRNTSFVNWLQTVLYKMKLKSVSTSSTSDRLSLDNITLAKNDNFFLKKNYVWDVLLYWMWDIRVLQSTTAQLETELFKNYTLSSLLKEWYNYVKDYVYLNEASIKQTSNGEYYTYVYGKYNELKTGTTLEDEKKYYINVAFYDKKDDKTFYQTVLKFTFDDLASKKAIDDMLSTVKTTSWELPFALWDMSTWDNLIETPEF